jgi:hypothetical protein
VPIFVQRVVEHVTYKMGAKLCAGNDTPWITFKCVFVNRSTNVDVGTDGTDGAGKSDDKIGRFCCIQWRRHRKNAKEK